MKKLLLLPITLPLGMVRGALEGALKTAADALMDLADGDGAQADVYVPEPYVGAAARATTGASARGATAAPVPPIPPIPPEPTPTEALEDLAAALEEEVELEELVADLEDEVEDLEVAGAGNGDVVDLPVTPVTAQAAAEDLGLESGRVEIEPDELVETEGAADPGAEITVDEPWPGYGAMKAPDVIDRLGVADAATKAIVRLYEQQHRKRRTVLAATER